MNCIQKLWGGMTFFLFLAGMGCSDSKMDVKDDPNEIVSDWTEETEMNETINDFLKEYYLWNDEYMKMSRDLTIPFVDSYDNFLKTTLYRMTTNTLDKKKKSSGGYNLYSYVDREEKKVESKSLRADGVNHGIEKDGNIDSYGFARLGVVEFEDTEGVSTGKYGLIVQSVYPNSSASAFGVNRGMLIYDVDGETITEKNYMSLYLELLNPTKKKVTLSVGEVQKDAKDVLLMATEIDPTPILKNQVIEKGTHKIGYLVYDSFDAGYDNELLEVVKDLKSKGITDLVLDLRYNGGGHVVSCMMLSSCIVGSRCKDQVFQYYRYNDTRMNNVASTKKKTGHEYDSSVKYFYENYVFDNYYGIQLGNYALNLEQLYVLTTSSTASASEVLINSLRGIGTEVVLVGEHTNGKNVGMEVKEFDKGDYSYELAPVTFQYYNAKRTTVPATGLTVDYAVSDWNNGYVDFGREDEPLLAKAIEVITKTTSSKAVSRSIAGIGIKEIAASLPEIDSPHPQGALVLESKSSY